MSSLNVKAAVLVELQYIQDDLGGLLGIMMSYANNECRVYFRLLNAKSDLAYRDMIKDALSEACRRCPRDRPT